MPDLKKLQKLLPKTIELKKDSVILIDQRLLPNKLKFIKVKTYQQMIQSIYDMNIRGAQAIGAAGAGGVFLGALAYKKNNPVEFKNYLEKVAKQIIATRPTAVNLAWAVEKTLASAQGLQVKEIKSKIFLAVKEIFESETLNNIKLGEHGAKFIKDGARILTHCNAGSLSGIWYGTATAPIYSAHLNKKKLLVYMDETRPMLQGARLTAWELKRAGVDCILNIDSASGYLISNKMIDLVIVGADRIARNGDVANKIGTFPLALMAYAYKIPFYVAAVSATIDFKLKSGKEIPIEKRNSDEILKDISYWGKPVSPKGLKAINPVFDVTPAKLVTKIITEKGIFSPQEIISLEKNHE